MGLYARAPVAAWEALEEAAGDDSMSGEGGNQGEGGETETGPQGVAAAIRSLLRSQAQGLPPVGSDDGAGSGEVVGSAAGEAPTEEVELEGEDDRASGAGVGQDNGGAGAEPEPDEMDESIAQLCQWVAQCLLSGCAIAGVSGLVRGDDGDGKDDAGAAIGTETASSLWDLVRSGMDAGEGSSDPASEVEASSSGSEAVDGPWSMPSASDEARLLQQLQEHRQERTSEDAAAGAGGKSKDSKGKGKDKAKAKGKAKGGKGAATAGGLPDDPLERAAFLSRLPRISTQVDAALVLDQAFGNGSAAADVGDSVEAADKDAQDVKTADQASSSETVAQNTVSAAVQCRDWICGAAGSTGAPIARVGPSVDGTEAEAEDESRGTSPLLAADRVLLQCIRRV